jgi:hypothetical protein
MSEFGKFEKGKPPMHLKLVISDGEDKIGKAQEADMPPLHQGERLDAPELLSALDKFRSASRDGSDKNGTEPYFYDPLKK